MASGPKQQALVQTPNVGAGSAMLPFLAPSPARTTTARRSRSPAGDPCFDCSTVIMQTAAPFGASVQIGIADPLIVWPNRGGRFPSLPRRQRECKSQRLLPRATGAARVDLAGLTPSRPCAISGSSMSMRVVLPRLSRGFSVATGDAVTITTRGNVLENPSLLITAVLTLARAWPTADVGGQCTESVR